MRAGQCPAGKFRQTYILANAQKSRKKRRSIKAYSPPNFARVQNGAADSRMTVVFIHTATLPASRYKVSSGLIKEHVVQGRVRIIWRGR